jgi:hypothetical protein
MDFFEIFVQKTVAGHRTRDTNDMIILKKSYENIAPRHSIEWQPTE